jgi:hypothetical protein
MMGFPTKEMIHINFPFCYFISALSASLVIRLILCLFRAGMPKGGSDDEEKEWREKTFGERYCIAFGGCDFKTGDRWLPYILGVAEFVAYPILFHFQQVTVIGGWIALKTAGNWAVWRKNRPSFYNFLFGNILAIFVSYIFMTSLINP